MLQVNFGDVRFSLTDDFMNTMIEDLSDKNKPKAIVVNNLCICSIAERGTEFCFEFAPKNNGVIYLEAAIFKIKAQFYSDGTITLVNITGGELIKTHLKMFVDYYNNVLCKIMIKEKMENGTNFVKKEDEKDLMKIKKDFEKKKK